jgi:hypothetical protein
MVADQHFHRNENQVFTTRQLLVHTAQRDVSAVADDTFHSATSTGVGEDADLGVEVIAGLGCGEGESVGAFGKHDAVLQRSGGHHPGQRRQPVAHQLVGQHIWGGQGETQAGGDNLPQVVSLADGLHVLSLQLCPDQKAHLPAARDEVGHAGGCHGQRAAGEEASHPVVADTGP